MSCASTTWLVLVLRHHLAYLVFVKVLFENTLEGGDKNADDGVTLVKVGLLDVVINVTKDPNEKLLNESEIPPVKCLEGTFDQLDVLQV